MPDVERRAPTPADRRAAILKSAADKPWGSGLGGLARTAGNTITDFASSLGLSPNVAGGLGFGAHVATEALPALLSGSMTAKLAQPVSEAAGSWLMKSALKPTLAMHKSGDATGAATTMLEMPSLGMQGVNATMGGVRKLQSSIDDLESTIGKISASTGANIDKAAVAGRIQDVISKIDRTNPIPNSARNAAESVYNEFMANPLIADKVPFAQAMELKRGIYRMLGDNAYKLGNKPAAEADSLKGLARGFREEMAVAVPEVAAPLAEQSSLIEALKVAQRRAMMAQNHNPLSLGVTLGALSHDPVAAAGMFANSSDFVKSLLARALYSGDVSFATGSSVPALQEILSKRK